MKTEKIFRPSCSEWDKELNTMDRETIVEIYNQVSKEFDIDEWNDGFMFPVMELAPDNKIRFSYREWTDIINGIQERSKYIDVEEAKKLLEELEKLKM